MVPQAHAAVKAELTGPRPMRLVARTAHFISKDEGVSVFPCGPSHTLAVQGPGGPVQQIVTKPEAKFEGHMYRTTDPDVARGLVNDKSNFGRPWGWDIDQACLPKEVRDLYVNLGRESRRKVALALINGERSETVIGMIDPAEIEAGRVAEQGSGSGRMQRLPCPVSKCSVVMEDMDFGLCQAAMMEHLRITHPDFQPERAAEAPKA